MGEGGPTHVFWKAGQLKWNLCREWPGNEEATTVTSSLYGNQETLTSDITAQLETWSLVCPEPGAR